MRYINPRFTYLLTYLRVQRRLGWISFSCLFYRQKIAVSASLLLSTYANEIMLQ